jgi:hypothetical protein
MSTNQENLETQHIEEQPDPHARIFVIAVAVLMVAEITFGLLNSLNVIHM